MYSEKVTKFDEITIIFKKGECPSQEISTLLWETAFLQKLVGKAPNRPHMVHRACSPTRSDVNVNTSIVDRPSLGRKM